MYARLRCRPIASGFEKFFRQFWRVYHFARMRTESPYAVSNMADYTEGEHRSGDQQPQSLPEVSLC